MPTPEKGPHFVVVTLMPDMFAPFFEMGVIGNAVKEGMARIDLVNPRDFATDRHRTVDDAPYGGGPGMVLKPGPVAKAIDKAKEIAPKAKVCHLSPQGVTLTDAIARKVATAESLILLCGRYAAIDQRVIDSKVDFELSVGDYVVSGGELPAMVLIDAALRHVPGVLGCGQSADADSFAGGMLAPPHYTRPPEFEGMKVPGVLLSGDHKKIGKWRDARSKERTKAKEQGLPEDLF